jgi:beta-glucanase (GH16 family)
MAAHGAPQLEFGGRAWSMYSGTGALGQKWAPENVQLGPKGTLVQKVENGAAGGISDPTPHLYGEWNVRFRMSAGAGAKYAILLIDHPHASEIDFAEGKKGGDDERKIMTSSVHYADGSIAHNQIEGDFTKYHTAGVIWKPGVVQFTLDGKLWATVTDERVPSVPMHFAIQTRSYAPGPTCYLEVSSVTQSVAP